MEACCSSCPQSLVSFRAWPTQPLHFVRFQRGLLQGSAHDFKYYERFQLALQVDEADYVYILDDGMIPGKRMLQILSHAAGTTKYHNDVLGSKGRILPFRQKDFSFPSYRKYGIREADLYMPDPAYNIAVEHVVEFNFLSSSWFLPVELVKTLFIETPFTFATGEDLHLRAQVYDEETCASGWVYLRQSIHNPNFAINTQSSKLGGCHGFGSHP